MNQHTFHKLIWGLLFITAGVFFILNQTGLISIKTDFKYLISTYWPVFLIYFGLSGLNWKSRGSWGGSLWCLICCFAGSLFLLKNLKILQLSYSDMMQFLWPSALIILGISIIFKPSGAKYKKDKPSWDSETYAQSKQIRREARKERRADYREQRKRELSDEEKEVLKDIHGVLKPPYTKENKYQDFVNNYYTDGVQVKSSFIGDVHLGQHPWELQPMMISHFIGDTIIDLTRAVIPLGETRITVSAFIGDVKIFIPNDVDVEVKVTSNSFIGDMNVLDRRESGMFRHLHTQTSYYEEAPSKLIVETNMFIGDVIVKKIG